MDMIVIINQMIQLFLIIALGYFMYHFDFLDINTNKRITRIVLSITTPALIVSSVLSSSSELDKNSVYTTFVIASVLFLIVALISYFLVNMTSIPKNEKGLFIFMNTFSNIGFMGFPVFNAIFGSGALLYAAIFNMLFNFYLFTLGKIMISYGNKNKVDISLKSMISPGIIASLIAVIIYFINVQFPIVLVDTILMVGGLTTPLAMLLIGSTLAAMPLKEVFNDKRIYVYAIIRQIIIPICIFPLLALCIYDEIVLGVTFIVFALPVANSAILFATNYNGNINLAAKTVFITTLLSVFTIPLLVYMYLI